MGFRDFCDNSQDIATDDGSNNRYGDVQAYVHAIRHEDYMKTVHFNDSNEDVSKVNNVGFIVHIVRLTFFH